jgi:crotonobetainyl-CoA:carnitine CoA-transferase CaiB-like acyl-CoA transferase
VPVGAYLIDGFTAMQGVIGILCALRHRNATGEGQWVRADMISTAMYMMAQEASYVMNVSADSERSRNGIAHVHQPAPYGIYEAMDGSVAVSVFGGGEAVRRAAEVLGILDSVQDYLTTTGLMIHRDAVAAAFARAIKTLTREQAIAQLSPTGLWVAPVRSLAEALEDPAVAVAGLVKEVDAEYGGRHRVVMEPLRLSESPLVHSRSAPAPGEHTTEILAELGFSTQEADDLTLQGVIFSRG